MSLMRRTRSELDLPSWFGTRPMFDWPDMWRDVMEKAELKVEEYEEDGTLVVRAELPGIDPEKDVEITVSDHVLHLRAERRSESRAEDKKGFRSEFHYGSFSRSVALPPAATEDDVQATYTDGILEVRIPIDTEKSESRKIPVARG